MKVTIFKSASLFILFFLSVAVAAVAKSATGGIATDSKTIMKQKQKAERAEKKLSKKKVKTRENYIMEKTAGTVYVFGVSQTLGKDEVYITEINTIDSLALQNQTRFLPFRSSFSLQFQQYTEGVLRQTNQTVCTFFNVNRDKLAKMLSSVKKRYLSNANKTVVTVTQDQFRFVHPLDLIEQSPMQETE